MTYFIWESNRRVTEGEARASILGREDDVTVVTVEFAGVATKGPGKTLSGARNHRRVVPSRPGGYAISAQMTRACFLVIDMRYPGTISTRKLVIETALMNVITAYSPEEAIETLERFRNVDGIVLDTEVEGMSCGDLIRRLRAVRADLPIVTVSPSGNDRCGAEDYHCSSYDPKDLLEQLKKICPGESRRAESENEK